MGTIAQRSEYLMHHLFQKIKYMIENNKVNSFLSMRCNYLCVSYANKVETDLARSDRYSDFVILVIIQSNSYSQGISNAADFDIIFGV